jgi:hypothetical protein
MEIVNRTAGIVTEQHFRFGRFRIGVVMPMHFNLPHFSGALFLETERATLAQGNSEFDGHFNSLPLPRHWLQRKIIRYVYQRREGVA